MLAAALLRAITDEAGKCCITGAIPALLQLDADEFPDVVDSVSALFVPAALAIARYRFPGREAITALLGGHIDLVTTAAGNVDAQVAAGKLRIVGVAANQRFTGALASIPTWKEQGINVVFGGWRAIIGPRGMSAAQSAFWETALRKVVETPEWKQDLEKNYWSDDFVAGENFRKEMAQDYAAMKSVLVDLGLASTDLMYFAAGTLDAPGAMFTDRKSVV